MKINAGMVIKIVGAALTLGGTILTGIAKDKKDKALIESLVKDHFDQQKGS